MDNATIEAAAVFAGAVTWLPATGAIWNMFLAHGVTPDNAGPAAVFAAIIPAAVVYGIVRALCEKWSS